VRHDRASRLCVTTVRRDCASQCYVTTDLAKSLTSHNTPLFGLKRDGIRWSGSFEATMDSCQVCSMPFEPKNTMRRDCCAYGFLHLGCIGNLDLERCRACQKDPMKDWTEGLARCCLRPFNFENPPLASKQGVRDVKAANYSLRMWREMVTSVMEEMTAAWTENVLVSGLEVGASFLDGTLLVDYKSMPPHLTLSRSSVRERLTNLICETVDRWAGTYCGQFTLDNISSYMLDHIAELTVRFTCIQWTYHVVSIDNRSRPFETKRTRQELGTWNCYACLSGLTNVCAGSGPQAKRFVVKEVTRNSR
jgi:hypothetical protein